MIETHEDVVLAALALPAEARAELVERLLSSLDSVEQAGVDAAWAEEAERRIDQLDLGQATLIPGDKLIEELQSRYK